jgi:hypothetical protein
VRDQGEASNVEAARRAERNAAIEIGTDSADEYGGTSFRPIGDVEVVKRAMALP